MKVSFKFRYVHRDRDRHGNVRLYYRRRVGEPKVRLRHEPGSAEFAAEYAAAHEGTQIEIETQGPTRPKVGTLRWLSVSYLASAEFGQLEPSTRRMRRRILESCLREPISPNARETFAEFPLSKITGKALRVLRDRKAHLPHAATDRVKTLRRLFSWALENDIVDSDPSRDVKRLKNVSDGHHSWTSEEIEQFETVHPIGTKARLAMALLLYTGVRRSDVVLLGRQHIKVGWLKFTAQKNRNRTPITIELPIPPALEAIIERSPVGDLTFLVTEYGKPFAAAGFGNWFRAQCDRAGLSECSAHGLRKAGATRAAENGATGHELMAIFGWLSLKEAERYCRGAQRRRLARNAARLLAKSSDEP